MLRTHLKAVSALSRLPSISQRMVMASVPTRGFRQIHDLHEVTYTANEELAARTAKYLEKTDKVYKPSHTLEFNREGELLLWSCDNIKHSTIYLKYPYCTQMGFIPLAWYMFFVNPFSFHWPFTLTCFYAANMFGWMPLVLYWKNLDRKIHRMYLLRGGKYVRIWTMNPMGDRHYSWANINEIHLLTEDGEDFAIPPEEEEFLTKAGQPKYEVMVQLDNYVDHALTHQDEIISFMKEGIVHQPEVFEMVLKGYNIDTSDYTINTDHSVRAFEPTDNY
jgi:hypothetical protein